MRRKPLRLQKAYDNYQITFGNAGFVIVYKNGKRLKKINKSLTFNRPRVLEEMK